MIDGESPLAKPPSRRKRQPLAPKSGNRPRLVSPRKRRVKAKRPRRAVDMSGLPTLGMTTIPTSSTGFSLGLSHSPGYSPTADENAEFKLTIGKWSNQKKRGNFTIFKDEDAGPMQTSLCPRKSLVAANPVYTPAIHTNQLRQAQQPWLQPQYQQNLYYNYPYASMQSNQPSHIPFSDFDLGKENMEPDRFRNEPIDQYQSINPLMFRSTPRNVQTLAANLDDPFSGPQHGFNASPMALEDPFGYDRNPLASAYSSLGYEYSSRQIKQDGFPPNRTVSDKLGNGVSGALFPTSE